ncbi:helix-turn-helix domain-containing protein [Streptomyces kronopolitis]
MLHAYLPDAQSAAYAAVSLHPDQDTADEQFLRDVPVPKPRTRVTGDRRAAYRMAAARTYTRGRFGTAAIAQHSRRSTFFVRTVLIEAKVVFRPPGRPAVRASSDSSCLYAVPGTCAPAEAAACRPKPASHSP